jgi:hypothetical protein
VQRREPEDWGFRPVSTIRKIPLPGTYGKYCVKANDFSILLEIYTQTNNKFGKCAGFSASTPLFLLGAQLHSLRARVDFFSIWVEMLDPQTRLVPFYLTNLEACLFSSPWFHFI